MKGTHKLVRDPESGEFVWVERTAPQRVEVDAPMVAVSRDRHCVAHSQPRAVRGFDGQWKHANPMAKKFNDKGQPLFDSQRAVDEYVAASGDISDVDAVEYE